jgi:RHS repeat-associated protein
MRALKNLSLRRFWFACVSAIIVVLVATFPASGQHIQYTQGSVGSGLDNTIEIPLRSYPGRGISLPVTLKYSSRVWRVGHLSTINNGQYQSIAEAIYSEYSTAGWTTSLDLPVIEWPKNADTYYYTGKPFCHVCDSNLRQFRVARLFMHMPDGSTHEMRKNDIPYDGPINMIGTFYAVDGSRLRYDSSGQSTGVLYLPNGTRYELNGATSRYIDANGNTLTYTAQTRQWQDTIGRTVGMPLPVSPQAQDYTYNLPGFENNPVPIIFRFKLLANALTPDPVTGLPPALRVVGTQYLPNPNAGPTGPSGGNYPVLNQTPTLFFADYDNADPEALIQTWMVGKNQPGNQVFNPVVLTDVIYPNGLSYKFSYNIYGEIDKVIYPTGAFEQYQYIPFHPIGDVRTPYSQGNRCVTSRKVSPNGTGNDLLTWSYTGSSRHVVATAPDGTKAETIRASFATPEHTGTRGTITKYWPFGFEDSRQGIVIEERSFDANSVMLRRKLYKYDQKAATVPPSIPQLDNTNKTAYRNPRPIRVVNILLDTGGDALAQTETYAYDTTFDMSVGLDLISTTERHFVAVNATNARQDAIDLIPTGTSIARKTETQYLDDAGYRSRNILGLRTFQFIKDGGDNVVAKSEWVYDEADYTADPYPDLDNVDYYTDPGTPLRGNVTTVRRWVNISGDIHLDTHTTYDEAGNPVAFENERLNESQMQFSAAYKRGYLTSTTTAVPDANNGHASNTAFTKTSAYDLTTGLIVSATDENGQITNFSYKEDDDIQIDVMNRLRKITRPDGGWTKYTFNDVVGDMFYMVQTKQDATRTLEQYAYVDKLGRSSRTFVSEGDGNYIVTDRLYDVMGRPLKTSNSYRTTTRSGTVDPATAPHWTTSTYDPLGRVTLLTLPGGATVTSEYSGVYTTVTDQAGKKKRQKLDALGRTVRVDEPDNSGSLGTVDSPTQPTSYTFNVLGQIIQVDQGQQHRYFRYDALGRMTHERQIEAKAFPFTTTDAQTAENPTSNTSWSSKRIYDETINNINYKGLLTASYDARNIVTEFSYDNLNRPTTITYSDGVTPRVDQYYDNVPFAVAGDNRPIFNKGHLTERRTAALGSIPSTSESFNHDLMGRTIQSRQSVGSNTYTMGYTFDVGSSMTSETYPSGRVVTYAYDSGARMSAITSGTTNYASNFQYGDQGLLESLTLGSGTVESYQYNSRLQLSRIDWTRSGTQIQRYNYKYGVFNPATGAVDEIKNNGQIAEIESLIGGVKQWQQNFTYDNVRRLLSAREKRGDTGEQSYQANYTYDVYGNRFQPELQNAGNPFTQVWVEEGQIAAATNRFTSGVTYDDAGNIIEDTRFRNLAFDYDANNRQRASSNINGSNRITSVYSASGQRLATMANNEIQSISVYDAKGTLIAEYGTTPLNDGTQYVLTDQQGTPRVRTNQSGVPTSRHDYLPFGEELSGNVGMRLPNHGYALNDGVNKKYAAMETDASGMSHTLWRKYDSLSARWTTTDPYSGSMNVNDPQSLNRYTYVGNDPVNETDPLGLAPADIGVMQTDNAWLANEIERRVTLATLSAIGSAQQQPHKPKDEPHTGNKDEQPKGHETKPGATGTPEPLGGGPGPIEKGIVLGIGGLAATILLGEGGAGAAGTVATGGAGAAGAIATGAGGGAEGAIITTGPEGGTPPETKAPVKPCISDHGPRGSATERTVLKAMNVVKYKGPCLNGVLPDAIDATRVIEVKDVKEIELRRQIRGELKVADDQGKRFVLVITERTQHIVGPLVKAIQARGGQILRYHGDGTFVDETSIWIGRLSGASSGGSGLRFNGEIIRRSRM